MNLPFLVETYRLALADDRQADAEPLIAAAVERARAKHADFDRFLPGLEALTRVLFCDHRQMPLDAYLETLYCVVKHGDFTRAWRAELKRPAASPVQ